MSNSNNSSIEDSYISNIFNILFRPEEIATIRFFDVVNFRFIAAIFFRKDLVLLQLMRQKYIEELLNLCDRFKTIDDLRLQKAYLNNYLCVLPYFEFTDKSHIKVPCFENNTWTLKKYEINKINLNKQYFLMNKADLSYAYGLKDLNSEQRLLIIPGTTYPAGNGFWPHVINDISIGFDVGYFLYHDGKDAMLSFIDEHKGECEVLGTSMGGAIALQLGIDHPDLKSVYAFNPPGRISTISENTPTASTQVVIQANDFVSSFGYWHPKWKIIHYTPENSYKPPQFFDHFCNYALMNNIKTTELDPTEENQKRFWLTSLVFIGLRALVTVILVWPIRYLIVPVLKLIYEIIATIASFFVQNEAETDNSIMLDI